ncbi:MAG: hypothetical protein NC311_05550 [Muribaculaceae bacterium]|nr:hypothetical protein [Muribaculaceae bacterium]
MLVRFLNAIGIYTKSQYMEARTTQRELADEFNKHKVSAREIAAKLEEKTTEVENLRKQLTAERERADNAQLTADTLKKNMDAAIADADASREAASENLDLIKGLQKQLGELFRDHPVFGFPNSVAIPGSTCVTTSDYAKEDGSRVAVMRGRTIFMDDMTGKIDGTPGITERTRLIMDYMERYGLFSKIGKDLMSHGGIKMTLAYNGDCTAYEAFYEAVVEHASGDAIVFVDKSPKALEEKAE